MACTRILSLALSGLTLPVMAGLQLGNQLGRVWHDCNSASRDVWRSQRLPELYTDASHRRSQL